MTLIRPFTIALGLGDHLLEVSWGTEALLAAALDNDCRASAIDHGPEMVRLVKQTYRDAVEKRLNVRKVDAEALPFEDGTFTCGTVTGMLEHLPNSIEVFREIDRVSRDGGRIVIVGSDPELRGTPAAPEPLTPRTSFYERDEFVGVAR